jgi:hypothetical protein
VKVLVAHLLVGADHPALEHTEIAFQSVHMHIATARIPCASG